jgi:ribonuclease P protein component
VTKKLGGAVVRNRIRRRLKEAVRLSAPPEARPDFDYVLIARDGALKCHFTDLRCDLSVALRRVHALDKHSHPGLTGDGGPQKSGPHRLKGPL